MQAACPRSHAGAQEVVADPGHLGGLVDAHDPRGRSTPSRRDHLVRGARRVPGVVEVEPEPRDWPEHAPPYLDRVLPHPAAEHDGVEPTKHRGVRADRLAYAVTVELQRQDGPLVALRGATQ